MHDQSDGKQHRYEWSDVQEQEENWVQETGSAVVTLPRTSIRVVVSVGVRHVGNPYAGFDGVSEEE